METEKGEVSKSAQNTRRSIKDKVWKKEKKKTVKLTAN